MTPATEEIAIAIEEHEEEDAYDLSSGIAGLLMASAEGLDVQARLADEAVGLAMTFQELAPEDIRTALRLIEDALVRRETR